MKFLRFLWFCAIFGIFNCTSKEPEPILFGAPVAVTVTGYSGQNLMEPFFSRDGKYLFFNNRNQAPDNTNLHWATRKDDKTFDYKGEISGVNTGADEATPTMDKAGTLYFISPRNYTSSLSTVFAGLFLNGAASNVALVEGVSKKQAGIVNFDVEINATGDTMYFVDGEFDGTAVPKSADIVIAKKTDGGFERLASSADIMKNINTVQLEYAASISSDDLTIYFTRVEAPVDPNSFPKIFFATRQKTDEPFGVPTLIPGLGDFVEAPSISSNGKLLYYHASQNGSYKIFLAKH